MLPARSDDSQLAGWPTLSVSQAPEIEVPSAGVVTVLMSESTQISGVLLSPPDYHELLRSVAQSVRTVAGTRLGDEGRRSERTETKQLTVKKVRISPLPEATISQLADAGRIALTSQLGTVQGFLLDLAEYELLRAAEALQMSAPLYRRMLAEGDGAWQGRETIKW